MPTIRYTRRALGRLGHIGDWIEKDNPTAARRVVGRIAKAIEGLAERPQIGRPGRISGTRELVLADLPYIVSYRLKGDDIEIITILHTSQRWPETF